MIGIPEYFAGIACYENLFERHLYRMKMEMQAGWNNG
jgi:hypothetical protein